MKVQDIKNIYKTIFDSYDHPSLETHIEKIIELDQYLPYSSTFFCLTNTQNYSFEYVSKNLKACLGYEAGIFKRQGMRHFWSLMHPEDIDCWLNALKELMIYTLEKIPVEQRNKMNYTWNYRLKNASGTYVNIVQNTTPLELDSEGKPIIGLAHYTVMHPDISLPVTATAKLLNNNNEYETKYFNNFSQKLLNEAISNRERDVIRLLALGFSSKDIAEKLVISSHTVDTHRRNILKKLNIKSTGELIGLLKSNKFLM